MSRITFSRVSRERRIDDNHTRFLTSPVVPPSLPSKDIKGELSSGKATADEHRVEELRGIMNLSKAQIDKCKLK